MHAVQVNATISADGTPISYLTVGEGDPLLVVGGAMRTASDYLPLARRLAAEHTVHLVERRGRGASGPLTDDYDLSRECEDLAAVQSATGAPAVFGHSFGGLVALQAAAGGAPFDRLVVYEPAVSVNGSIPTGWLNPYARRLAGGDSRGAFNEFVRGSGHAPAILTRAPRWYTRLILAAAVRGHRWDAMAPLLTANLLEHREVAHHEGLDRYRSVACHVHVLAGQRSPRRQTEVLRQLVATLPRAEFDVLAGLDHNAPDEKAPDAVADRVSAAMRAGAASDADPGVR